ncbi:ImmA/IrrE family metallo-endopeptidase [Methanobrevibacter sp.]
MDYSNYFEMNELANKCRRNWNIHDSNPIDIISLALNKINNLTISFLNFDGNFSGSSCIASNQVLIFINSNHPLGRQRFTLAHEIYHLMAEKNHIDLSSLSYEEIESNAENFASCLLLPHGGLDSYEEEFNIEKWTLEDIIKAEQYYQLSHDAFLFRLNLLGKITEEEREKFKPHIKRNAKKLGFTQQLYESYTNYEELVIGNYIRLTELSYDNQLISKEKRDELLFNKNNEPSTSKQQNNIEK